MTDDVFEAPADLESEGRRFWAAVVADWRAEGLKPLPQEAVLLAEAARMVDRLAQLRDLAAEETPGSLKWMALTREERQQRAVLGRVVAAAGLPTGVVLGDQGDKGRGGSPQSRRGQKAAAARWRHNGATA